jgi:non-reducing end alpha-L-arabinofuranosidase
MTITKHPIRCVARAGQFRSASCLLLASLIGCGNGTSNSGSPTVIGDAATGGRTAGSGGAIGSSGGVTAGGETNGGTASVGTGGKNPGAGGSTATGGATASGGSTSGGASTIGGTSTTGGKAASGGAGATGGKAAAGGASATGGKAATGGAGATGGKAAAGGASAVAGAIGTGGSTTVTGPCDIYQAGNVPCVAAHSTVRALYGAYSGNLYQVRRTSDKTTKEIGVLAPGGFADAAAQDTFCVGTKCTISVIYDQSPQHNHLTLTKGGWIGDRAKEADAVGIKLSVGGHTVYGIHVPQSDGSTGVGYRNNLATGTAKNDEPESMYMVANGKYYNDQCCFDYGNAEANSLNNGNGTMEAIYFGNCGSWGTGEGKGPWVMADLENGLFSGKNARLNAADKSITSEFVTAMLKGKPHTWAIKAGDSQSGGLATMYEGAYPSGGYDPMKKEGAIVLGTGGDNSFMGVGDFFEGAMTTGYASDATEDAVQANVVAAGYGR